MFVTNSPNYLFVLSVSKRSYSSPTASLLREPAGSPSPGPAARSPAPRWSAPPSAASRRRPGSTHTVASSSGSRAPALAAASACSALHALLHTYVLPQHPLRRLELRSVAVQAPETVQERKQLQQVDHHQDREGDDLRISSSFLLPVGGSAHSCPSERPPGSDTARRSCPCG